MIQEKKVSVKKPGTNGLVLLKFVWLEFFAAEEL